MEEVNILTASAGLRNDESSVQSANTSVSNTNGRTVFRGIGIILKFFLCTFKIATCFGTASPSHKDVATELPGKHIVAVRSCDFSSNNNQMGR